MLAHWISISKYNIIHMTPRIDQTKIHNILKRHTNVINWILTVKFTMLVSDFGYK